jgi:hypothetical protein
VGSERDDEIDLWIGRIVREDVQVEGTLRGLFAKMVGADSPSLVLVPGDAGRLLSACKSMAPLVSAWTREQAEAIVSMLDDVGIARQRRNRVTHDQLFEDGSDIESTQWMRMRYKAGQLGPVDIDWVDVDHFRAAFIDVRRARIRALGALLTFEPTEIVEMAAGVRDPWLLVEGGFPVEAILRGVE